MGLETLVSLLIYVMVIGLVCWLLWWLIGYVGIPEPFNKVARVIVAVFAVVILVGVLMQFAPALPLRR